MPTDHASSRRRMPRWLVAAFLMAATVGILVLLALPLRTVPADAEAARTELEAAKSALQAGKTDQAAERVANARIHADDVQESAQGIGGDIWSLIPIAGTPVRDVRHLGNALDDLTSVAELGVESYAEINDKQTPLFTHETVDIDALESIVGRLTRAHAHLTDAREELEEVADSAPLVGDDAARARDTALETVTPLQEASERIQPLAQQLPSIFGADGERKYLIAMLNPAELRYSGGAPLTFAPVTVREGSLDIGKSINTERAVFRPVFWKKVEGNPFHRGRGRQRITAANFAPSWPVSGEETLNAWRALRGRNGAGLIAVDVVALARLTEITGPMNVPGAGLVNADNLVETLVGSYERFPSKQGRRDANEALFEIFRERLFEGGQLPEKISALHEAAQGRHFAVYFRDDEAQTAFASVSMTGDLSQTKHDYLGTFTQNTVPSKSDFWQRRTQTSQVSLRPDGSARVRQVVHIHNDTTPYPLPGVDPQEGYVTRWLKTSVGAFLPRGAEVTSATFDGEPFDFNVGDYFGRPYVRHSMVLAPQAEGEVLLEYDVPQAAVVTDDGTLSYRLDVDPQGMVIPEALNVTVTVPKGHVLADLPDGWRRVDRRTARWRETALESSLSFELTVRTP